MNKTLVKIYANFSPVDTNCIAIVEKAMSSALGSDLPWISLKDAILCISWEGVYFPVEDVLQTLAVTLEKNTQGKLDYLDLENWTLTRYSLTNNGFQASKRDLNHILEYSGTHVQ